MAKHGWLLGVLVSACLTPAVAEINFERYEVVTDPAQRKTFVTGFFLDGGMAEFAELHIDENGDANLRIYEFGRRTWAPTFETKLRPGVLFVDVVNIDGHDRLLMYERGRLNWFDPESETERALLAVSSNFNPPREDEIPHVDVTRDVNGDGRDDLVVPDVDGFHVIIQTAGGAFADPVRIGPATEMARILGAGGYRYDPWSQSRVHTIDYDRDGRNDLVFWNDDHFEVHTQDERGLFAPLAEAFTTAVAFDSDDLSSLATGDMTGRVLHSLTDLNGDDVADMGIFSLQGKSISGKQSTYEVHFGAPAPGGGTTFSAAVDKTFQSDGSILLGMQRHDFDGDGQADLMFTTIERRFLTSSLWKRLKGMMGDDIRLRLEFYRMDAGRYTDTPDTVRVMGLDGPPSHREPGWVPLDLVLEGATHQNRNTREGWPNSFNATLRFADMNGDGRSDLLKGGHPRILGLHVGVPAPHLFAQQGQEVKIPVPNDEEYIWLTDVNKDGKQDIVMHRPFALRDGHGAPTQPPGTEPHRITLLIAQ